MDIELSLIHIFGITAGNLIYLTGVALGGFLCHLGCRYCLHSVKTLPDSRR